MKEELHGDEHCILQYIFHLVRHNMFFLFFSFLGVRRGRHQPGWVGSGCSLGKTLLNIWHGVPWSPLIGYGSWIGWWLWHGECLECVSLAKMSQIFGSSTLDSGTREWDMHLSRLVAIKV